MEFRKAVETDINNIMNIIKEAQVYFQEQGIDQWQNNYPNWEVISEDIAAEISYVLLKDSNIVATAAVAFTGEKTYDAVYEGEWLSTNEYAVIHRMAVADKYKGLGFSSHIIKKVEELCLNKGVRSIKVDTHEDNLAMQRLLKKNQFKYCGIIFLEDNSKRIAFEKLL